MSDAGPEATRDCGACGRPFVGKAGRVVDGRPVCPTCGNRLRPKVSCAECGRPTARPRRRTPDGGLVCEGCLNRDTHATCKVCRRHRPIAIRGDDGALTCAGCAAAEPATRACPDCGAAVPGRGAAPCGPCSLKRLIARRVAACAPLVGPPWARALFEAFGAWPDLPRDRNAVARRMDAYARCFAAIGAGCAGPGEVTQARLLALLGNEEMRHEVLVVRFLAGRLGLAWDAATSEDAAERRRIGAKLAEHAGRPWGADLRSYSDHLAADDLRPKTVRVYLAAAAGLLAGSRVARAASLEQAHVRLFLRRSPGHRANLARFVSWLPTIGGPPLSMHQRREPNLRRRERAVLQDARRLLEALDGVTDARRGMALHAAAISRLYQVPLTRVLTLPRTEVLWEQEGGVVLWPEGLRLTLTPELATGFRRFAAATGPLAFPGRSGVQPLSTAAVAHHRRWRDRGRRPGADDRDPVPGTDGEAAGSEDAAWGDSSGAEY